MALRALGKSTFWLHFVMIPLAVAAAFVSICLKTDQLTDSILLYYPRYTRVQDAFTVLEDFRYPNPTPSGGNNISVLDIDHPAWRVMLDFIRSDIAFRKSARNAPSAPQPPPEHTPSEGMLTDQPQPLPEINWNRLKTIMVFQISGPRVAGRPLVPPYHLMVLWPVSPRSVPRSVYEFLSFQEFRSDVKRMLVQELDYYTTIAAAIVVLCEALLIILRSRGKP
jgi:hypothetical protein